MRKKITLYSCFGKNQDIETSISEFVRMVSGSFVFFCFIGTLEFRSGEKNFFLVNDSLLGLGYLGCISGHSQFRFWTDGLNVYKQVFNSDDCYKGIIRYSDSYSNLYNLKKKFDKQGSSLLDSQIRYYTKSALSFFIKNKKEIL